MVRILDFHCRGLGLLPDQRTEGVPQAVWRRQKRKERQIPYAVIYMWNLNYDTNELIYETESDLQT